MKTALHRTEWNCYRALVLASLLLFSIQWVCVGAEFIVNLNVVGFDNPSNTDATGACCIVAEAADACSTPCNISKYNICIRPSGSNPLANECPILNIPSNSGGAFHSSEPWPGSIEILITPLEVDANPVEMFEIEYEAKAAQSGATATTDALSVAGTKNDSVLNLTLAIQCQLGFHGPMCECRDRNDSTGHFSCTRDGEIVCLEGYQNPSTNCTECSPAPGCSAEGGFCEEPGDCLCRQGFSGNNCSLSISTGVVDILPTSTAVPVLESLPVVVVQTVSVTLSSPPPVVISSVEIITTSSVQLSVMMSSTELPMELSVTVNSNSSTMQPPTSADLRSTVDSPTLTSTPVVSTFFSSLVESPPVSLVQSTQGPSRTSPVVIAESTGVLTSSLGGFSSSNLLISPSLPTTPTALTTTLIQQPETTVIQATTPIIQEPQTTTVQELPTTTMQEPQSTTLQMPTTTTVQESQTSSSSIIPEQSTFSVTQTGSLTNPTMPTTPVIIVPTSPTPPPPTTTDPPAPSSGNQAVITGAVGVIGAVVVLVVLAIPCAYFIMKKRRRNEKMRAAVFLDNVYNTPVTFVNPEHEVISPRSPELYVPGENEPENRGTHLDVSHKPTFPGVGYREHVPYAETGPSSDHTESPEEPRLQHVEEDAEVTIIFNPHSFSSNSSQSPQPSTPATGAAAEITTSSSPNRRSGSGFDYKDDPVGDKAYLAAQYYIEQPLGSSPPSSSVASGRSGSGGSEDAGLSSGSGAPPLPPRVLLKPSHLPRTGGSGIEQSRRGGGPKKQTGGSWKPERRQRERKESEEEDDEDGMKRRASEYLQAAQEEGEKRQSFMRDVNFFTDINLDMTTQTEL